MPPEPPRNAGYMVAGYVVTAVILLGYLCSLWRRARRAVSGDITPPAGTAAPR
jgi:hypothetical protein